MSLIPNCIVVPRHGAGFTLVELMIAITLSLIVISGLVGLFLTSSESTRQMDDSSKQIENGQYALSRLEWELNHAGYLSYFNPELGMVTPAATPDPCQTGIPQLTAALPIHVQGFDGGDNTLACAPDQVADSDVLVVRRLSVCATGSSADCGVLGGVPYFQASSCQSNLELGSPNINNHFRLSYARAQLDRTRRDCATVEEDRRYLVNLFYIRSYYETRGDGVPTLVRSQLDPGHPDSVAGFVVTPMAKNMESMQIEYGIDEDGDGAPDLFSADPDNAIDPGTGLACAPADCAQRWRDTVAAKVYLLARTESERQRKPDEKTFTLGLDVDGNPYTINAAKDRRQRNVFQTLARLNNPAIRRE